MIIRVDTYLITSHMPGAPVADNTIHETTRDIDYTRKADRIWLSKHSQWAFNNGRGIQTYRVR